MKITKEMVCRLNRELLRMGCVFCFEFQYCMSGRNTQIELKPLNSKFVHSSIINLTDEFYDFLEGFFKSEGINELSYNNTATIIWSKVGWDKSK